MAIAWPGTLPKTFEQSSFSESRQDGVIRTEMSTGPVKTRRRFTAVSKYWDGVMIFTPAQKTTFDTYFEDTIAYGSVNIDFPNQYDAGATTVEARFTSPVSYSPDGGTLDWKVSMSLEVLP